MKEIEEISSSYMQAAIRVKQFFFLCQELHKLNHMYVFSHEWFFKLLFQVLKDLKCHPKVKNKQAWIKSEFTKQFYQEACQTLFERDKVIFSFLMAYKVVQTEAEVDMNLLEFFIKGSLQEDLDPQQLDSQPTERAEARAKNVPWINEHTWQALDKLSQIAPFNQKTNTTWCRNLSHHIETHPDEWRQWLDRMAQHDQTYRDMEFIAQMEDEEMQDQEVVQMEQYKSRYSSSSQSDSDAERDVKLHNTKFFNRRIEQMRKLGTIIPNGFEEDKIAGKTKQNMQGQSLATRLRVGLRRLVGMAESQLEAEAALEKVIAYDMDSDNNNTENESPPPEEFYGEMGINNTQEED